MTQLTLLDLIIRVCFMLSTRSEQIFPVKGRWYVCESLFSGDHVVYTVSGEMHSFRVERRPLSFSVSALNWAECSWQDPTPSVPRAGSEKRPPSSGGCRALGVPLFAMSLLAWPHV